MADQKVERDLPAKLQISFHEFKLFFMIKTLKKPIFAQLLKSCISADILRNFLQPRLRTF